MGSESSTSGRILAVVTDLMLESRIREKARAVDYEPRLGTRLILPGLGAGVAAQEHEAARSLDRAEQAVARALRLPQGLHQNPAASLRVEVPIFFFSLNFRTSLIVSSKMDFSDGLIDGIDFFFFFKISLTFLIPSCMIL